MKKIIIFLILSLTFSAIADDKSSFGVDERVDIYQTNFRIKRFSTGVANWQSPVFYEETKDGYQLDFPTLEESGLCSDEKFAKQHTAVIACTGFLVAPKVFPQLQIQKF